MVDCEVIWLGEVEYSTAWRLQEQLAGEIAAGARSPTLLLLEHPHVYTIGRTGSAKNVLWSEAQRAEMGVTLHDVDRGGDVTYHGPGQLVGYPLLPLAPPGWNRAGSSERLPRVDFVGFIRKLEAVLVGALARLGVPAGQRSGFTGVWIQEAVWARCPRCDPAQKPQPAKIASIGIKIDSAGISRHGFALNIATDPRYWDGIIACGLQQVTMANLADFLDPLPPGEVIRAAILDEFFRVFAMRMVSLPSIPQPRKIDNP